MEKKKHRNPTMKRSPKVESKDHAGNLALIQQLNELENVWKSQEKSRRRCSTASDTTSITIIASSHLLQKSPRTLMSSLQRSKSDFRRVLRVKNRSDGVEEILMDRRAAIITGRFKGRQLFGPAQTQTTTEEEYSGDSYSDDDVDDMNYDGSGGRKEDIRDELLLDFNEPCPFPEEEKTVAEVAKRGGDWRRKEKVSGFMLATACLAVVLLVLFSMSCKGKYMEELIQVPT